MRRRGRQPGLTLLLIPPEAGLRCVLAFAPADLEKAGPRRLRRDAEIISVLSSAPSWAAVTPERLPEIQRIIRAALEDLARYGCHVRGDGGWSFVMMENERRLRDRQRHPNRGFVAVVGSRELAPAWAAQMSEVVRFFLARDWGIGPGGARGADEFVLEAVVAAGASACARSVVFLPGAFSGAPGGALGAFAARGKRVVAGSGAGRPALLGRSRRLAQASAGVVAFLWGPSRGSVFTVRCAVQAGKPAAVVLAGGGAALPAPGRRARWAASRRSGGCRRLTRRTSTATTPSRSARRSTASSSCRRASRSTR